MYEYSTDEEEETLAVTGSLEVSVQLYIEHVRRITAVG